MGLPEHLPVISKVTDVAGKEFAIEMALDKMQNEWKSIELQVRTCGIRVGRCKPVGARTGRTLVVCNSPPPKNLGGGRCKYVYFLFYFHKDYIVMLQSVTFCRV